MGELKKTFGAGLAVLIILLLAPYYLQWIGYETTLDNQAFIEPDTGSLVSGALSSLSLEKIEVMVGEVEDLAATQPPEQLPSKKNLEEKINLIAKEFQGLLQEKTEKKDITIDHARTTLLTLYPQLLNLIGDGGGLKEEITGAYLVDHVEIAVDLVKTFIVETPLYTAHLSSLGGGSFTNYSLVGYSGAWVDNRYVDSLKVTLLSNNVGGCAPCVGVSGMSPDQPENFDCSFPGWEEKDNIFLEDGESLELICRLTVGNTEIIKTTLFNGSSFVVNHHIDQRGRGDLFQGYWVWNSGINNTEKNLYDDVSYSGISVSHNQEIETLSFIPGSLTDTLENSGSYSGNIDWTAIRNKYFIVAMIPESPVGLVSLDGGAKQFANKEVSPVYGVELRSTDQSQNMSINTYFGPLEIDNINQLETTLDRIMNFGWFIIQPFSRGILWLLKFFHSFGMNYGVVLILFAFLVRFITGPLTKKSFESTQKMQAIQPQLKKLQEKYKNDSQKLNTEMVKMYKENGVNPLGGCFPMLLQMPLLFALFMVFRSTIEFRGAPFFWWIKDLSLPDTIFNLPFWIPIYGDQVAFLPILLGVSMFLTQKMSMANMEGGMAQQKYMMYFMSAFFFLIFNSFPSGLNLYYLIYNVLNYLQQKSLKKA